MDSRLMVLDCPAYLDNEGAGRTELLCVSECNFPALTTQEPTSAAKAGSVCGARP